MPTPLVVPNAAQLRLIWALNGSLYALNVMGVVANAVGITQTIANTVGAAVKTGFASSSQNAAVSIPVTLVNVGLRDLRTAGQPEFLDAGAAVAGTNPSDPLPPQVALVITLRTALVGQHYRGRVYLPGFGETTNTTSGAASSGSNGVTFIGTIKSALQGSGMDLGVISRPNPLATPPWTGFVTTVTSIVCRDLVWDTQRRRAIPGI